MRYDRFLPLVAALVVITAMKNNMSEATRYEALSAEKDSVTVKFVEDEYMVETKFMVKLELNLPWKPILAWPWGVRCEIEPTTNLIRLHEESWDIEAIEGVKQIFRKPTTTI